jgi:hypothetical protein
MEVIDRFLSKPQLLVCFDKAQLIIAIVAMLSSFVAMGFVGFNERRRRLRREFRELLWQRLQKDGNRIEEDFADRIISCLITNDLDKLKNARPEKYLEEYIADIEFKPKLYRLLVDRIRHKRAEFDPSTLRAVLETIESWRESKSAVERDVLNYIGEAAKRERAAKEVRSFIETRSDYFENKADLFVKDVKQAVESALTQ